MPAVLAGSLIKTGTAIVWLLVTAAVIWILPLWLTLRMPVSGVPVVGNAAGLLLEMTYAPQLAVSNVIPPIWRLLSFTIVASSVSIGLAALPMFEFGMGALIVTTSLLTVLPVRLVTPGAALPTQLFMFVQVASTGALDQVWLAARACQVAANVIRQETAHVLAVPGGLFLRWLFSMRPIDVREFEGVGVFIAGYLDNLGCMWITLQIAQRCAIASSVDAGQYRKTVSEFEIWRWPETMIHD